MLYCLTKKLDIPIDFVPTKHERTSWFVSPVGNNYDENQRFVWWIPLAAMLPGLLVFVILFFEVELIG